MWKSVLAGTTALAIAGGTLAYAQQGPAQQGPAQQGPAQQEQAQRGPHWRPSAEDIGALGDARIAALHAGLKLTADQEKNWPALEAALRDLNKQRQERLAARANADRPRDPVERLSTMADVMQARGAALKKVAEAAGPLYNSLDDGQKHRFMLLARMLRPNAGRFGMMGERGGGGGQHRGPHGHMGPQDESPSRL